MVSLRSGKRTVRPSPGVTAEKKEEQAPLPTETPKRRGRVTKKSEQVVDEPEEVEELLESPVESQESDAASESTPASGEAEEDFLDTEESEKAPEITSDMKSDTDEPREISEDVFANCGNGGERSDDEDSFDAFDEPMEFSSKQREITPSEDEIVSDSADDEPMEVSSKVEEKSVKDGKSFVEKLLEKKAEKTAKKAAKKLKKRSKKKDFKKVAEGVFEVKMKKSKSKFNVVTLKNGIQHKLEPEINFREELLKSRTAGSRVADTDKFLQRAKWVSKN